MGKIKSTHESLCGLISLEVHDDEGGAFRVLPPIDCTPGVIREIEWRCPLGEWSGTGTRSCNSVRHSRGAR